MLFKEIIPVYTDNHTETINTKLIIVKAAGTNSYHSVLNS
jgi:hypothetical protein